MRCEALEDLCSPGTGRCIMTPSLCVLIRITGARRQPSFVAREKESIYACYVSNPRLTNCLARLPETCLWLICEPLARVMQRKPVTVSALDYHEAVAKNM